MARALQPAWRPPMTWESSQVWLEWSSARGRGPRTLRSPESPFNAGGHGMAQPPRGMHRTRAGSHIPLHKA